MLARKIVRDEVGKDYTGFLSGKRGNRLLPDLRTAIFARLKGYVDGFYPHELTGAAAELGYYPLSEATPEELAQIETEAQRIS